MNTIIIGTILFRENVYRYQPVTISMHIVTSVGKKYFEVDNGQIKKISIETLKYEDKNYTQNNIQFYLSQKDIADKNERNELIRQIKNHFNCSSLLHITLTDFRKIAEILNGCVNGEPEFQKKCEPTLHFKNS